jgi:hypothetical protein
LRKAIKIKAYTILLAWGMIFAHCVIPHNHIDECSTICTESNHLAGADANDPGRTVEFLPHSEDVRICHISGFLFHQFNQDNLISDSSGDISVSPINLAVRNLLSSSDSFITEYWNSSASLRAPPSA